MTCLISHSALELGGLPGSDAVTFGADAPHVPCYDHFQPGLLLLQEDHCSRGMA